MRTALEQSAGSLQAKLKGRNAQPINPSGYVTGCEWRQGRNQLRQKRSWYRNIQYGITERNAHLSRSVSDLPRDESRLNLQL